MDTQFCNFLRNLDLYLNLDILTFYVSHQIRRDFMLMGD